MPAFAEDAGEEPEIAGLYVIGQDRKPYRLGYAVGNEFSDHVMERQNYLYLAHSKLRSCSYGPELRLGELPQHLAGTSRIVRNGEVLWQSEFLSGEANMCHSLENLEYHHFKYTQFLRPGMCISTSLARQPCRLPKAFVPGPGMYLKSARPNSARP